VAAKFKDEHKASTVVFVDDGEEESLPDSEKTEFNTYLDLSDRQVKSAEEAGCDVVAEEVNREALTLYQCSDEDGTYKVTEIKTGPLVKRDLKTKVSLRVLF
jgi:hypothetical protein